MNTSAAVSRTCRWGARGALFTLAGVILSGPAVVFALSVTHPQPAWTNAEQFVRHYHGSQALPYFGGLFLVFGFVAMMASLYELASAEQKARAMTAVIFTATFAALVFLNYVIQTTFVANMARSYSPESAAIVSAFSMANPSSLAWAIEMWAYGFLGVGHWLIAPVFSGSPVERSTANLFVANGVVSAITAVSVAVSPAWMMTATGSVAYAAWNLLIVAMVGFAFTSLRRRMGAGASERSIVIMNAAKEPVRKSYATASDNSP